MNWNRIEGNWGKFKDCAQQRWGELTAEQLDAIAGKRECLSGNIQRSYGITRDEAEKQLGAWQVQQKLSGMRMQFDPKNVGQLFPKSRC
jgi:uncharacterized protein YjbJ (UPF0337 family)